MKVLLISHNSLSTYNNMGKTLYSLLGGIKKEELCQLYIYPSKPNIDCCSSFYNISDVDVLKSFFKFKVKGRQISKIISESNYFSEEKFKNVYSKPKERKIAEMYIRDFVWKYSHWFNKDLKKWLNKEKPTCIFVAPGKYNFFYEIALKCQKYLNIPIITYICDDFYFISEKEMSFFKKIYYKKLKKNISHLLNNSSHLITISESMKNEYSKKFNIPVSTVMTGSTINLENDNNIKKNINSMTYMGNIGAGRYKSLCDIANCLDIYNKNNNSNITLKIYTSNSDFEKINEFKKYNSIKLMGYVSGEEYNNTFLSSEILVHVEGMNEENISTVKYSISTKIADCLKSNICILGYGPKEVASISYLKENNAAIVCVERENLYETIEKLLTDYDARFYAIENANKLACLNHDINRNRSEIINIIENVEKKIKVLQVNCVYKNGSTGKIVYDIHNELRKNGHRSIICYGRGERNDEDNVYKITNELYSKINNLLTRINGLMYSGFLFSNLRLYKIIKNEKPHVVHLHCLNSYFINIYKLINWLKKNKIKTVLTLHAEFMYTANCGYALGCEKWKTGCGKCPRLKKETKSIFFDRTNYSWNLMKKSFDDFDELCIVSVSPWLMNRAKDSIILKNKMHMVIYNGVDTNIFKIYNKDYIREKYNISKATKIVLHVTSNFNNKIDSIKGGAYLLKLAEMAEKDNIKFVVIGKYDYNIKVPKNLIFIGNINEPIELAKYYSSSDLTVLTSKSETFSMVTIESLCCGTPVVGFKAGAPEQIALKDYSKFVEFGNIKELYVEMKKMLNTNNNSEIMNHAHKEYSSKEMYLKYLNLYKKIGGFNEKK